MEMVEVKVQALSGRALDWAVAAGLNGKKEYLAVFGGTKALGKDITAEVINGNIAPSTNHIQGGMLIELFGITTIRTFNYSDENEKWTGDARAYEHYIDASLPGLDGFGVTGPTQLIAGCRALVESFFQSEIIKVPAELLGDNHEQ